GGGGRQHGAAGVAIKEAFVERERHRDGVAVDGAVVGGGHRGTGAGDGECGGGAEDGGGAGEGAGSRHAGPLSEGQRGERLKTSGDPHVMSWPSVRPGLRRPHEKGRTIFPGRPRPAPAQARRCSSASRSRACVMIRWISSAQLGRSSIMPTT